MSMGLILSRHVNEQIVVGDELVVITVVEIEGNTVRLALKSDREIPIHRREVAERIKKEEANDA